MTTPLASALFASLVCVGVISLLLRSGLAQRVIDLPNERSLHAAPVPRIGGLGVVAGVLPVILWQPGREMTLLGVCVGLLALVSLADDIRSSASSGPSDGDLSPGITVHGDLSPGILSPGITVHTGVSVHGEREHHILAKLVSELNFLSPPRAVFKSSTHSPFSLTV